MPRQPRRDKAERSGVSFPRIRNFAFDLTDLYNIDQIDYLPTIADREDFDLWYENGYLYYTDNTATGSELIIRNVGTVGINRAPTANDQNSIVDEDDAVTITLSGSDPDGDPISYSITAAPDFGTLSGTAPNITYTPNPDFSGNDQFGFTVSDGDLEATATVSITVNPVNDDPVIEVIPAQTVTEGSLLEFEVTVSDIDGDVLSISADQLPDGATLDNGVFTWTPTYEQAGSYTITVSVTDGNATAIEDFEITISNLNRAQSADAQSVTTDEDNAVAITLTGSDPDGQALTYLVAAQPSNGTLSGTAPNLTYTPNANYNSGDEITFTVSNGELTAGATFTGSTFTWTPAFDQVGIYTITISVTDGKVSRSQISFLSQMPGKISGVFLRR